MIHADNLVKSHGQTPVLRGVTLLVAPGEVAAVIGPSGGGKSTLLRCLNALETFDGGAITVDGLVLRPGPTPADPDTLRRMRRRVGMVFQQFHLFPHMTVLENVTSGPRLALGRTAAQAEPAARALLDRVGLAHKCDARPDQLSGGQQQRVAIARALAMEPAALLFDEPTSALDPQMAREVTAVMADLAQTGQTMVVVTHAMEFARRTAHTVHVMIGGKMAESGPAERIFSAPSAPETRLFLQNSQA